MKSDQTYLIRNLAQVYLNNRSINWMLKSSAIGKVEIMIKYILKAAKYSGGILLSDDENFAVVYLKRKNDLVGRIKEFIWNNIFIKYVISKESSKKFMQHQNYLKSKYPDNEILQVVLVSVTPHNVNDPRHDEVMQKLIDISEEERMPVYLETSTPPFIPFFERYGFEMYHEWDRGVTNFPLWLYRRECKI